MSVGVYQRGRRWRWECMFEGKRKFGYEATETEAVRAREAALKYLEFGEYELDDPHTLGGMVKIMLATEWSEENCKSHEWFVRNCRLIMDYFRPETALEEITSQEITSYVLFLREERHSANGTINRKLAALSKILRVASEQGYLEQRPVIRRQREPQGRIRFLSEDEERDMLQYFIKQMEAIPLNAVIVLMDTGIRCGELQKLTVEDIDWEAGRHGIIICKDTKNGTSRSVPLTKRAAKAIQFLEDFSEDDLHLVPRNDCWLRTPWERMKKAIGLAEDSEFVPHCLRHTCASRLVQAGVPIFTVSKWLGHKSINTTKRYAHLRPEDLYDAAQVLDRG